MAAVALGPVVGRWTGLSSWLHTLLLTGLGPGPSRDWRLRQPGANSALPDNLVCYCPAAWKVETVTGWALMFTPYGVATIWTWTPTKVCMPRAAPRPPNLVT